MPRRQLPRAMQRWGLEWAFRLSKEPRRLWRRYLLVNPMYLALFALQATGLYTIEPARALSPEAETALRQGTLDAAMFFSPRTARIFGALADALSTERLTAFCISPATAQALTPRRFAQVAVATRPNQDAMLALVE